MTEQKPEVEPVSDRPTPLPNDEMMTADEVAARFRVPRRTVERWRSDRTGPRFGRFGRHVRYRRDDVEEWAASRFAEWDSWQAS